MEACWVQRRFADRGAQERVRKEFVRRGESTGNGGLYRSDEGRGVSSGVEMKTNGVTHNALDRNGNGVVPNAVAHKEDKMVV